MTRPDLARDLYGLEWLDYVDDPEGEPDTLTIINPGGGTAGKPDKPESWAGNLPEVRG